MLKTEKKREREREMKSPAEETKKNMYIQHTPRIRTMFIVAKSWGKMFES